MRLPPRSPVSFSVLDSKAVRAVKHLPHWPPCRCRAPRLYCDEGHPGRFESKTRSGLIANCLSDESVRLCAARSHRTGGQGLCGLNHWNSPEGSQLTNGGSRDHVPRRRGLGLGAVLFEGVAELPFEFLVLRIRPCLGNAVRPSRQRDYRSEDGQGIARFTGNGWTLLGPLWLCPAASAPCVESDEPSQHEDGDATNHGSEVWPRHVPLRLHGSASGQLPVSHRPASSDGGANPASRNDE